MQLVYLHQTLKMKISLYLTMKTNLPPQNPKPQQQQQQHRLDQNEVHPNSKSQLMRHWLNDLIPLASCSMMSDQRW